MTQHFEDQKCDYATVEQIGAEYETKYKKLADNTPDLTDADRDKKLNEVRETIKSQNDDCFALNDTTLLKADIEQIVNAYNERKDALGKEAKEHATPPAEEEGQAQS